LQSPHPDTFDIGAQERWSEWHALRVAKMGEASCRFC